MDITEQFTTGADLGNLTDEVAIYDGIGMFKDPVGD